MCYLIRLWTFCFHLHLKDLVSSLCLSFLITCKRTVSYQLKPDDLFCFHRQSQLVTILMGLGMAVCNTTRQHNWDKIWNQQVWVDATCVWVNFVSTHKARLIIVLPSFKSTRYKINSYNKLVLMLTRVPVNFCKVH